MAEHMATNVRDGRRACRRCNAEDVGLVKISENETDDFGLRLEDSIQLQTTLRAGIVQYIAFSIMHSMLYTRCYTDIRLMLPQPPLIRAVSPQLASGADLHIARIIVGILLCLISQSFYLSMLIMRSSYLLLLVSISRVLSLPTAHADALAIRDAAIWDSDALDDFILATREEEDEGFSGDILSTRESLEDSEEELLGLRELGLSHDAATDLNRRLPPARAPSAGPARGSAYEMSRVDGLYRRANFGSAQRPQARKAAFAVNEATSLFRRTSNGPGSQLSRRVARLPSSSNAKMGSSSAMSRVDTLYRRTTSGQSNPQSVMRFGNGGAARKGAQAHNEVYGLYRRASDTVPQLSKRVVRLPTSSGGGAKGSAQALPSQDILYRRDLPVVGGFLSRKLAPNFAPHRLSTVPHRSHRVFDGRLQNLAVADTPVSGLYRRSPPANSGLYRREHSATKAAPLKHEKPRKQQHVQSQPPASLPPSPFLKGISTTPAVAFDPVDGLYRRTSTTGASQLPLSASVPGLVNPAPEQLGPEPLRKQKSKQTERRQRQRQRQRKSKQRAQKGVNAGAAVHTPIALGGPEGGSGGSAESGGAVEGLY